MENSSTEPATQTAILAGGCFWCMEPVFDSIPGVLSVMPGYSGGFLPDPSYQQVCEGETGHLEAVEIVFDPSLVSYRELLLVFWRNIDPTTKNRQFCDYGPQYQTAVFYLNEEQRREAEESRDEAQRMNLLGESVVTEIRPASEFYPAEEYHRQYYKKNPYHYQRYHDGCGRNWRLKELWGEKKG
ncbi:MAG: peptide-methionine (S)-S-oxide reductase MsrA [Geobacter sp.]|nr:MAG: peptide-methionine (S)-S-oxide reductase MsrA [Geobacter sp.]